MTKRLFLVWRIRVYSLSFLKNGRQYSSVVFFSPLHAASRSSPSSFNSETFSCSLLIFATSLSCLQGKNTETNLKASTFLGSGYRGGNQLTASSPPLALEKDIHALKYVLQIQNSNDATWLDPQASQPSPDFLRSACLSQPRT